MTYLKTLIALTTLALLTACAGGVAVNNTFNSGPTALTCTQNPFGTTCTAPTPTEAKAFCSDASKPTTTKANDCAPTVIRVCGENPYDAGLCIDNNDYTNARQLIRLTCTNTDDNLRDPLCPEAVATECTADPFLDVCRLGTAGVTDGEYDLARKSQITTTCPTNVHDEICHNVEPYETTRQGILSNCETNVGTGNACPANVVMQVCIGNPYNTVLCNDPAIDYTTQRMERLEACKGNNGLAGCAAAAATTCPANPFQAGICFIGTTYMSQRDSETLACRGTPNGANCGDAQTAVCTLNAFDAFCKDVALFIDAQIDGCADATATTTQCIALFSPELARCFENPFRVECDTEPTFMDSKVSVRKKRFDFCETDTQSDARCGGYRTCNNPLAFASLTTCGADFQPTRVTFCKVTDNAFDQLCIDNGLTDATAQLAYCKLDTSDPFGTNCGGTAFREAREEFCMATPATQGCNDDVLNESLMKAPVVVDPCAGLSTPACTVEYADLPTYPATPNTSSRSEFLAITATTASTLTEGLVPTTLFIPGSTTNGLAFFNENNAYYTGILAGTNLGAPITETITTAVRWTGQIRSDGSHGALVLDENEITDFWLDITFDGNKGKIMNDLTSLDGTFYYQIKGTFDNKGVISGLVEFGHTTGTGDARALDAGHALYTPGTLTGLIGRNSAVGAFINGHASINGGLVGVAYGGGFVVTPPDPCVALDTCVDTAAWLASFEGGNALPTTPNTTTRVSQFLQATATGFASGANAGIRTTIGSPQTDIAIQTLPFANTDTATGGVAFFGGELYSGQAGSETGTGNDFYYAGVLDGTNLGAPITETITTAVRWTGQIRAVASSNTAELFAGTITDFGVNITFDGTEGTIKSAFATNPQFVYEIDGVFDENGIITGDVDFGAGDATNGINPTQFRSSYSPGTLRGIIGQNGAVGVFHSDNENSEAGSNVARFSGGFVVTPPTN